jgi:hypothetical protein
MPNVIFELEKLRVFLLNKGLDQRAVDAIVNKARNEIRDALTYHGEAAMQAAIEKGVEKRSSDFINELKLDEINMMLTTDSGNMDFTIPPYPNLQNLLRNAKPIKDGSGVYKVIPVGGDRGNRPAMSTNIYDAWKRINAERIENAKEQYARISPKSSAGKVKFRTATSKQSAATQWVMPAQGGDFTDDVRDINTDLSRTMDEVIRDIVRSYEEVF